LGGKTTNLQHIYERTAQDVKGKLDKMTKYVVYEVLIWPQGSFSFHLIEKHDPEILAIDLGITMDQLVMDGLRRLDELKVMKQSIHSASQVFERDVEKQIDMSKLSENQQKVVPHLDGIKDLGKIKDLLKLDTYDVTRALHGLLKSGFIREKTVGKRTVNE